MNIIEQLEKEQASAVAAKRAVPDFAPGDTVIVNVKVVEGDRSRVHCPQDLLWRRRRARLPGLFAADRFDQGGAERRRPPRQTLLPARAHRQIGAYRREAARSGAERL